MNNRSFESFAGLLAILTGIAGFLYSIAFIVLQSNLLSGLFLMLGGLLSTAIWVAVYNRLRDTDATFALWALLLGITGALGSAIHGGYDLANAISPPPSLPPDLPSQIDPRGLLTFGVTGVALFVVAWLMGRGGSFPKGLSYLGYLLAVFVVILYLGRLIILAPTNPLILVPALLAGFLLNPAWYLWLGFALWRGQRA
jgi:hypothetical protein